MDRGNIVINMLARIKYTKMLGKLQEPYVPVNFKEYKDIYVFCDSDPIGYYLSYKKIYFNTNRIAKRYISGAIFFALPQATLIITYEITPKAIPSEML